MPTPSSITSSVAAGRNMAVCQNRPVLTTIQPPGHSIKQPRRASTQNSCLGTPFTPDVGKDGVKPYAVANRLSERQHSWFQSTPGQADIIRNGRPSWSGPAAD